MAQEHTASVHASVHVYTYADKVRWAIFTWFHAFVGVCLHVYECARACAPGTNRGTVAVEVLLPWYDGGEGGGGRWVVTDAADLRFNVMAAKSDEYLTLICRREQRAFVNAEWGRWR